MNKIFSTNLPGKIYTDLGLLIVRVLGGSFMLTHGLPKLLKLFSGDEIKFADPFGFGEVPSFVLAVFAEAVCSFLITLGLATRLASVPLIITMLVAAFHAHADDPFAVKEKALLFATVFIVTMVFGSGKYSVDHFLNKR